MRSTAVDPKLDVGRPIIYCIISLLVLKTKTIHFNEEQIRCSQAVRMAGGRPVVGKVSVKSKLPIRKIYSSRTISQVFPLRTFRFVDKRFR